MVTGQQFRENMFRLVEALNARDWATVGQVIDKTVVDDYVGHLPGATGPVRGRDALKQYFRRGLESMPDVRDTVEDAFVVGDRSATRFTVRRTDPATGKARRATFLLISQLRDGKFAEDWEVAGLWEDEG